MFKNKTKRVFVALGGCIIAFILGTLLVLPLFSKQKDFDIADVSGVDDIFNDLADSPPPIEEPFIYETFTAPSQSFGMKNITVKHVNRTYWQGWANDTIEWYLEKSSNAISWDDCSYLLNIDKEFNPSNVSYKYTVNWTAEDKKYYRLIKRTNVSANLTDYFDRSIDNKWLLNYTFDGGEIYNAFFDWGDYNDSDYADNSSVSHLIKVSESKLFFEFIITSDDKLDNGQFVSIDPFWGDDSEYATVYNIVEEDKSVLEYVIGMEITPSIDCKITEVMAYLGEDSTGTVTGACAIYLADGGFESTIANGVTDHFEIDNLRGPGTSWHNFTFTGTLPELNASETYYLVISADGSDLSNQKAAWIYYFEPGANTTVTTTDVYPEFPAFDDHNFNLDTSDYMSIYCNYTVIDNTPPEIEVDYAGHLQDKKGPRYIPPSETVINSYDGYSTNASYHTEDWILIRANFTEPETTIADAMVKFDDDGTITWVSMTNVSGVFKCNTSGNVTIGANSKCTFDIYANNSALTSNHSYWNKTGLGGTNVRRYVYLNCPSTDITFSPLYLWDNDEVYVGGNEDDWKADRFRYDAGTDGTFHDVGLLRNDTLTDTVQWIYCSAFIQFWFGENVSVAPFTIDNILIHTWWGSQTKGLDGTNSGVSWNYSRTELPLADAILYRNKYDTDSTNNKSQIDWDNGNGTYDNDYYLEHQWWDVTNLLVGDNDIYEVGINFAEATTQYPNAISNASFKSYIIFNVPDNATLKNMDNDSDGLNNYEEIWLTYTDCWDDDTDNDGISDYWENASTSDGNNYTETFNVTKPEIQVNQIVNGSTDVATTPTINVTFWENTTSGEMTVEWYENTSDYRLYHCNDTDGQGWKRREYGSTDESYEFTPTEYADISVDDDNYVALSADTMFTKSLYQFFNFTLEEPADKIDSLNITWKGYGVCEGSALPCNFKFYDFDNGTWDSKGAVSDTSKTTYWRNETDATQYVNATNNFHIRLNTLNPDDGNDTIYSYYIQVEVHSQGVWRLYQINNSVGNGESHDWVYSNATEGSTKYWWKAVVNTSYITNDSWFEFTTEEGVELPPWNLITLIYGNYTNNTLHRQIGNIIYGNYTNNTLFRQINNIIFGNYTNNTLHRNIATIFGNYTNDTALYNNIATIYGNYTNTSVDSTPPEIVIDYAGNLSDSGGPYWLPPDESEINSYAGYYTNFSYQDEDFIFIRANITEPESELDNVMVEFNDDGDITWHSMNNVSGQYRFNSSGNVTISATSLCTFDIYANSSGGSNHSWWNKSVPGGGYARRTVHLNCVSENISYNPFYLHNITYTDTNERDGWTFDQSTGALTDDTGVWMSDTPTDTVIDVWCLSYIGVWFNESTSPESFTFDNLMFRIWWANDTAHAESTLFGWDKERSLWVDNFIDSISVSRSDGKSNITYDAGHTPDFSTNYSLIQKKITTTSTDFTDNDIFEFIFIVDNDESISIICNRSFITSIWFNVPTNDTLKDTDTDDDGINDYYELFEISTSPNHVDSDNDGINDFWENESGSDPNNFTETYNVTIWNNIATIFGNYTNNTLHRNIDTIFGNYTNQTSIHQIGNIIFGNYTNLTTYRNIVTVFGNYTNNTLHRQIGNIIYGNYTNTSVVANWNNIDTIYGNYTNNTLHRQIGNTVFGNYTNQTSIHQIGNIIFGNYTNNTLHRNIVIVFGNYTNDTLHRQIGNIIFGNYTNTTALPNWNQIGNIVFGNYTNDTALYNQIGNIIYGNYTNTTVVFISIANVYPSNNSFNVLLQPNVYALFNSTNGSSLNISWFYGLEGSENTLLGNESNVANGTYNELFYAAINYSTDYNWRIQADDGYRWVNETFSFMTESDITILSGGGSNVGIVGAIGVFGLLGFIMVVMMSNKKKKKREYDEYYRR